MVVASVLQSPSMFRSSNNKVNPSQKERNQKRAKQEKHKRFLEAQRLKEQVRIEQANNLALLSFQFRPGLFYELTKPFLLRVKSRTLWLMTGAVVLFVQIKPHSHRELYCFRMIAGEDVGELTLNFNQAMEALKPVDMSSCLS